MTRAEYNDNIQTWSGIVLRFAMWNCGDRMRSEDAMQEAFAKLWERKEDVTVEKATGFLITIARRFLIDSVRHDNVVARVHGEMAKQGEASYNSDNYGIDDVLLGALNSLPEVQRSVIQLRDVDGYSYKEIGEMLDLSDQQVQVYLFRARTNMRKYILKNSNDKI